MFRIQAEKEISVRYPVCSVLYWYDQMTRMLYTVHNEQEGGSSFHKPIVSYDKQESLLQRPP